MCKVVGADFDAIDFKSPDWFRAYSWSDEQAIAFKEWMVNYIYARKSAQRELYDRSNMRKRDCVKAVEWFVFNHGWKYSD
jgi:hypothetical protein